MGRVDLQSAATIEITTATETAARTKIAARLHDCEEDSWFEAGSVA